MCVAPRDSEYLSALSRYPRERDWPDVRVTTFRQMIYSEYWYEKRLKSSLYRTEGQDDNVTDEKVGPGFMLQLLSSYARKTPQKWKNSAE